MWMPERLRANITGEPNDQQYIDRKQGLTDALAARDDIEILDEYNVQNSKDLGMSTTEDCLMSYDSFDAIVCQNDDAALGVVQALKSAGMLEDVLVLGVDGSDDALAFHDGSAGCQRAGRGRSGYFRPAPGRCGSGGN